MALLTGKSIFIISTIISLSACKPKLAVGSLKADTSESRYNCDDHGDKCNFKDDVTNSKFNGKVEEDEVSDYINRGIESSYNKTPFENYKNDGLGEFKIELYKTAKEVFGNDQEALALVVAMAMLETTEIRGWDKSKDDDIDGSANFSVFNMNEDFLNSIRHDISKAGKKDPIPYVDKSTRGKNFWFNTFNYTNEGGWENEGRLNLKEQIQYLKYAFDMWGVTNTLIIHRSGYDGLKSSDSLNFKSNKDYLQGMRKITKTLLEKPYYYNPDASQQGAPEKPMNYRVSLTIPHI